MAKLPDIVPAILPDLKVSRGNTAKLYLDFKDSSGDAINLSSISFTTDSRNDLVTVVKLGTLGRIQIELDTDQSPGNYPWSVTWHVGTDSRTVISNTLKVVSR